MAKLSPLSNKLPLWLLASALATGTACNSTRLDTEENYEDGVDMSLADYRRDGSVDARPRNRDAACASVKAEATLGKKPVDIIFVIDNSGSMSDEILAVQNNINKNFADIISKSGLDYRVIMLTSHGSATSAQSVCINAPLASNPSCSPVPTMPGINPPRFYHYSIEVESSDSFRRILDSYNGNAGAKDKFGLAPLGWSTWLRSEAFKVFIEITDDNSDMTAAGFESQLFAKMPKHFGDLSARNYAFHSIVGLKENNPATKAWGPTDPIQMNLCTRGGGAVANGIEYQKLSMATGGLRFPICEYANFDAVFQAVATGVVSGTKVNCDFPLPKPPMGEEIDLDSVILDYVPGGTGTPQTFKKVKDQASCMPNSFYIDNNRIYICADACKTVQMDTKAKVQVLFDCKVVIG